MGNHATVWEIRNEQAKKKPGRDKRPGCDKGAIEEVRDGLVYWWPRQVPGRRHDVRNLDALRLLFLALLFQQLRHDAELRVRDGVRHTGQLVEPDFVANAFRRDAGFVQREVNRLLLLLWLLALFFFLFAQDFFDFLACFFLRWDFHIFHLNRIVMTLKAARFSSSLGDSL